MFTPVCAALCCVLLLRCCCCVVSYACVRVLTHRREMCVVRVVVRVACAAAIRWWWCWLVGIPETSPLGTCLFILQVQPAPQCRQYTRHVPVFFFDTRTSPQPTNRSKRSDSAVRLRERKKKTPSPQMRPAVLSANGTVLHRASRPRPGDDVRESVLSLLGLLAEQ